MSINDFELGKTRIMAEAREALRRVGIDYHCVMFDLHGSDPDPSGASLSVAANGETASGWFSSEEIRDSKERVNRADVKQKIAALAAGVRKEVA